MLVIMMEDHLLSPAAVCGSCPMASQNGLPRWRRGRLRCGRSIERTAELSNTSRADRSTDCSAEPKAPLQYECAMGFRVAKLSEKSA